MYAENIPMDTTINCQNNPAALIYAVTTNDCPCPTDYFYNSEHCEC
jgi:hypothetical protein